MLEYAAMRARCRAETLEAKRRRLRPDGELRPERGGHEAEIGERREIDGFAPGDARGEMISGWRIVVSPGLSLKMTSSGDNTTSPRRRALT